MSTSTSIGIASGIAREVLGATAIGIAQEVVTEGIAREVLTECPGMPLYDLALECIRKHTEHGCMFALNTMDAVRAAFPDNSLVKAESSLFFELCSLLDENEIFCLNEGIDRREEFGIAA
jgi:hypothetical protein